MITEVVTTMRHTIQDWIRHIKVTAQDATYVRELIIAGMIAVSLGAAWGGYLWYTHYRNLQVQRQFIEEVQQFNKVAHKGGDWAHVQTMLEIGAQQAGSAVTAPYFYGYLAQALAHKDKTDVSTTCIDKSGMDEAVANMDKALQQMSKHNPAKSLFRISRALMILDTDAMHEHGAAQATLAEIGNNKRDAASDLALYYLGSYHWHHNNYDQARTAWQELVQRSHEDRLAPSPWASLVEPLLEQLPA